MIILNETTYKELFSEYYEPLCNIAFRYMNDVDNSEDVVQEVFVHLWNKRKEINIKSSLKNYLFSSVKNKCIEKLRRNKLENKYIAEKLENNYYEMDTGEDELEKLLLIKKLYYSIDELPNKCSIIFKMAKLEGMTYTEIGENLGLSVKTIESQMRRAFILLREKLT